MTNNALSPFLACYDYGGGGVWLLLDAPTVDAARLAYPEFVVFETRPDWMTEEEELEFRADREWFGYRWDINEPPSGWLKEFFDRPIG